MYMVRAACFIPSFNLASALGNGKVNHVNSKQTQDVCKAMKRMSTKIPIRIHVNAAETLTKMNMINEEDVE